MKRMKLQKWYKKVSSSIHYGNDCNSNKCDNCGRVEHFAKDCRVDKNVEETTNLALDDETNGLLLMAQNDDLKAREHDGAKDDGGGLEAVETIGNEGIHSGLGEIAVSETRKSKNDSGLNRRLRTVSMRVLELRDMAA